MEVSSKQTTLEKITLEEFVSMVKSVEPQRLEKKESGKGFAVLPKMLSKIFNTLRYHIARGCYSERDYIKYIAPYAIGNNNFTLVIERRHYEDLYPDYDDVYTTFFNGALFRGKPKIEAESDLRSIDNAVVLFGDIWDQKYDSERDEEHKEIRELFWYLDRKLEKFL